MTPAAHGRVLVALHEPGYFRLYGSTIVELGRRGWDVMLAFDRPDKRSGAQVPEGSGREVRSVGAIPDVAAGRLASWRCAVDYLRYLERPFHDADYLRRRSEKTLPEAFRFLTKVRRLPRFVVGGVIRAMRGAERTAPADPNLVGWLKELAPDVVFVSPLVTLGPSSDRQTELIKAARVAGVPSIVGVASWDHLTSKGLVRLVPDVLLVWNEAQAREAERLHRIPASRIVVTGAQSLDHWFETVTPAATAAFRASLGIADGRPVILFVGSSRNMAPGRTEVEFVQRWSAALRASSVPVVRDAFMLVRPHPTNTEPWQDADLGRDVVVHPRSYSGIPLAATEVETFRQSLTASAAVVGVNTTAMIEAAIHDRPVLTVRDPAFEHSQAGTLHFAHLPVESGGCALVGRDLTEHVAQLEQVLRDPGMAVGASRRFVQRFVRPRGLAEPATAVVASAIEDVAAQHVEPRRVAAGGRSDEALAREAGTLR